MGKGKLETPSEEILDSQAKKLDHQFKTDKLEAGWLGGFFGKGEAQKNNIVGFICLLMIIAGLLYSCFRSDALDFWKSIVLPILTGALGYLFGKK
ncbi:MAG TPA: hypothetical protein VEP90_19285 [Methylomirabilota bacterium]|nr:hypothetical protein [Methylomirabilota bacterium]